ncbi:hypothetical protein THASP1DRAFT_22202 [Thamnocephalis sphaerospora]|uniref:CSC1/OSCA1-like 7TM region domain-containing protein n=1 Tax=Thamnocephalis sphaerospora TaxID=78915 RepID=A0A4P9XUV5_9FUNG|nr:hypothetical protein THASP1DRAFT_22202 [Thamnocephalis sphaerospora]|eukprot:RKP10034.1 hypothetical protein THASP1DRAFT_22202 [Thamnocephalis sphaerospora]
MATLKERNSDPSFDGLATQLGLSWGITTLCVGAFEILRRTKWLQHLYTPRCRLAKDPTPPIPNGLFQWIPATMRLSEEFMLTHTGLDTVMHLRFLKTACQLMLISFMVIGGVLLPLNHRYEKSENGARLESFSMTPIEKTEPVLYVHMMLTYVFTGLTIWFFYRDMLAFVKLRREFVMRSVSDGRLCSRTVMVTELPKHLRSDEGLRQYFTSLGIGQVESAKVLRHSSKLSRRLVRREQHLVELERLHIELAKNVMTAVRQRRTLRQLRNDSDQTLDAGMLRHEEDAAGIQNSPQLPSLGEASRWRSNGQHTDGGTIRNLLSMVARTFGRQREQPPSAAMYRATHNLLGATGLGRPGQLLVSGSQPTDPIGEDEGFNIWRTLTDLPPQALDPFQPMRLSMKAHHARQQPAIDYHLRKFNKQDRRVAELRASYIRDAKPTTTGFVTFVHPASAQLCAQSIISADSSSHRIHMAPEPHDIIWQNHKVNRNVRRARRTTINIAIWSLTIFWLFIMSTIILGPSFTDLIEKIKNANKSNERSQFFAGLIGDVLPPAIIALFMSILPFILLSVSEKTESLPTYSAIESVTLRRYFIFAIFNAVIVFLIGKAFLETARGVIEGNRDIYTTLGETIPQGATFFINYVVFSTCIHGLELVQLFVPLAYSLCMTSTLVKNTPRTLQYRRTPLSFPYFYYFPLHILMLVVSMIYAVINPLILAFATIYFAVAYLVFKHQFAYAYVRRYETGGRYWRKAFAYTIDSLVLMQLTMIGILSVKQMTYASLALAPAIIATVAFRIWCHRRFDRRIKFLPLETLRDAGVMMVNRRRDLEMAECATLAVRPVANDVKRHAGVDVVSFVQSVPGSPGHSQMDTLRNTGALRINAQSDTYGGPGLHMAGPPSNISESSQSVNESPTHAKRADYVAGKDKQAVNDGDLSSLDSADLHPTSSVVGASEACLIQNAAGDSSPHGGSDRNSSKSSAADVASMRRQRESALGRSTPSSPLPLSGGPSPVTIDMYRASSDATSRSVPASTLAEARRRVGMPMHGFRGFRGEKSRELTRHTTAESGESLVRATAVALDTRSSAPRTLMNPQETASLHIPSPVAERSSPRESMPSHVATSGEDANERSSASDDVPADCQVNQPYLAGSSTAAEALASASPTDHGPYTPRQHTAPCRRVYRDLMGDVEDTFLDPDAIRPLSWNLWLPMHPDRRRIDLDAVVEVDTALVSSRARISGRLGVFDEQGYMYPPRHQCVNGAVAASSAGFDTQLTSFGATSVASSTHSDDHDIDRAMPR